MYIADAPVAFKMWWGQIYIEGCNMPLIGLHTVILEFFNVKE